MLILPESGCAMNSSERCRVVTYGPECKDANEHLCKYGIASLRIAIEQAAEVPLEGIFTAADLHDDLRALFDNGFGPGAETGWEEMDKICTYERGRSVYVTGVPGAGKSEGGRIGVASLPAASMENRVL